MIPPKINAPRPQIAGGGGGGIGSAKVAGSNPQPTGVTPLLAHTVTQLAFLAGVAERSYCVRTAAPIPHPSMLLEGRWRRQKGRWCFSVCLCSSLPKSILVSEKLIFPQVAPVLPMMVIGERSVCLYMTHEPPHPLFPSCPAEEGQQVSSWVGAMSEPTTLLAHAPSPAPQVL